MNRIISFLSVLAITLFGCNSNPSKPEPEENPSPARQEPATIGNFTIVPGQSFGLLTAANSSKEEVIAAYGAENVKTDSVYVGEGFWLPGLLVFPGTKNELQIAYDPQISPDQPAFLRVESEGGEWKTPSGLRVGATLAETVAANGRDFKFSGFGWDYGGTVTDWEGGQLEGLLVRMDNTANDVLPDKFVGEQAVSSGDTDLGKLGIKVSSISLRF